MNGWKMLNDIPDLREKLMGRLIYQFEKKKISLESTKELIEITQKDKPSPKKIKKKIKENEINLEKEVEKLIENSAYHAPDGLWYVYDHEKKEWRSQDEVKLILF